MIPNLTEHTVFSLIEAPGAKTRVRGASNFPLGMQHKVPGNPLHHAIYWQAFGQNHEFLLAILVQSSDVKIIKFRQ